MEGKIPKKKPPLQHLHCALITRRDEFSTKTPGSHRDKWQPCHACTENQPQRRTYAWLQRPSFNLASNGKRRQEQQYVVQPRTEHYGATSKQRSGPNRERHPENYKQVPSSPKPRKHLSQGRKHDRSSDNLRRGWPSLRSVEDARC